MVNLSTSFRTTITRRRNELAKIIATVDAQSNIEVLTLDSNDLKKFNLWSNTKRNELTRILTSITETHTKWTEALDDIEDEEVRAEENSVYEMYFTDDDPSHKCPYASIHTVSEEIGDRVARLRSNEEQTATMASWSDTRTVTPVQEVPQVQAPSVSVTPVGEQSTTVNKTLINNILPSLPQITLPKFNGRGNWIQFWNSFEDIIDNSSELSTVMKNRYFEGCLHGEALELYRHYETRGCEYKEIIESFKKEYQDSGQNKINLIRELKSLKPKSDSIDEQMKTVRHIETLIAQLKKAGEDPDANSILLTEIIERFPYTSQRHVYLKNKESSEPLTLSKSMEILREKLKEDLEIREYCKSNRKQSSPSNTPVNVVADEAVKKAKKPMKGGKVPSTPKKNAHSKPPIMPNTEVIDVNLKCIFCKKHTNSINCRSVKQSDKRSKLLQEGRCLKCFQQGHKATDCSRPNCTYCYSAHHYSVCPQVRLVTPDTNYRMSNPRHSHDTPVQPNPPPVNQYSHRDSRQSFDVRKHNQSTVAVAASTFSDHIRMLTGKATLVNTQSERCKQVDVFLDSGSGATILSTDIRKQLNLPTLEVVRMNLTGLGGRGKGYKDYDVVAFDVITHNGPIPIRAIVHDDPITSELPLARLSTADKEVLKNSSMRMADSIDRKTRILPKLLIGLQYFHEFVDLNKRQLPSGLFYVQTALGTMVVGETDDEQIRKRPVNVCVPNYSIVNDDSTTDEELSKSDSILDKDLNKTLHKFLSVENKILEDKMTPEKESRRAEDERIRQYFLDNLTFENGSYYARYAFTPKVEKLGDGFNQAWIRLKQMLKKIGNDPTKLKLIDDIFQKQLQAGQIEVVNNGMRDGKVIRYIPMQLVVKESSETTPYRVVIDASAHGKDEPSLNDCLEGPGSNLLEEIPRMLLRISLHKVLLAGDIEKAFLQIKIHSDQRDMLRVLWLKDINSPPSIENLLMMRYTSAAFGLKQSPYLLMATLFHHAEKRLDNIELDRSNYEDRIISGEFDDDPNDFYVNEFEVSVLRDILTNCYVDNLILYCEDENELQQIYQEAKYTFASMGMNIRCFFSSNDEFTRTLSKENGDQGPIGETKILGVSYDTTTDRWIMKCNLESNTDKTITKREVLSRLASIFNPLGQLVPLLLPAKRFVQKLFDKKYGWDDPLDEQDRKNWLKIVRSAMIAELPIPRLINILPRDPNIFHLALFTDASHSAMGAVVYLWTTDGARFLIAKNQLAPTKDSKTTPKLELQALVLGMQLLIYVSQSIYHYTREFRYTVYTDATTVLQWLKSHRAGTATKLGVYVVNRLTKIDEAEKTLSDYTCPYNDRRELPVPISYYHVPGTDNPADHATRGLNAEELSNYDHIWWKGPEWLSLPPDKWLRGEVPEDIKVDELLSSTPVNSIQFKRQNIPEIASPFEFLQVDRFSSFNKLTRVGAYVLRFLKMKCPSTLEKCTAFTSPPNPGRPPSAGELRDVKVILLRQHQSDNAEEMEKLHESDFGLDKNDQGLVIVVSGRVDNALIPESAKRPILLFKKKSSIPKLIISSTHLKLMHRGAPHVLNELRREFWLIHGLKMVSSVIRGCIACKRAHNTPFPYPAAPPLPPERVQDSRPFQHIGLDFLGPLKVNLPPNKESTKAYVLLCTCMSTRLVHLEVTLDLSTSSFLNALDRFISTRGVPESITSDNAPSFKLADRVLQDRWQSFERDHSVLSYVADRQIEWRWITAYAPWKGGFYERLVGSVKSAFNAVYARRTLTYDELNTQMKKVEAIVNSRPLTHLHSDFSSTQELAVLRPCDFISPRVKLAVPHTQISKDTLSDPDYVPPEEYNATRANLIDRFNKMEKNLDKFWEIFNSFYINQLREQQRLHALQAAGRSHKRHDRPERGEIVLIVDDMQPRGMWKLARVLHSNERTVTMTTGNDREISRPINKVVPLELISSLPSDSEDKPKKREPAVSHRPPIPSRPFRKAKVGKNYREEEVEESSGYCRTCSAISAARPREPNPKISPWSLKYILLTGLILLSCLPIVSSNQILCEGNRVSYRHDNDFPIYQICGDGECYVVNPVNDSIRETTSFSTSSTIHGYQATVKYLRNGELHLEHEECPAYEFCDNIKCTFCLATIANPECSPSVALFSIGLLTYFIGLVIYALCCRPIILGSPISSSCSFLKSIVLVLFHLLFKCVCLPLKCFLKLCKRTPRDTPLPPRRRRTAAQRTATQRHRAYSILVVTTIFTLFTSSPACQEVVQLSSLSKNCKDHDCKEIRNVLLKVNPITKEACIVVSKDKSILGEIKLTVKSVELQCLPSIIGYHRDVEVKYVHSKRCPRTGSCVDDKCGNITSTTKIRELAEGNLYPGHTHCEESCGGPGCDCFFLSSGCLFYRTFVFPRSRSTYHTFECPEWRPIVNIEVRQSLGNESTVDQYALTPNQRVKVEEHQLELTSFSVPPIPLLSKQFITNESEKKVGLLKYPPITHCMSEKHSMKFNCSSTESCKCATTERSAVCECNQVRLEDNFNIENVLPILTPMLKLYPYKSTPFASLYQFTSIELALSMDTSIWDMEYTDYTPIKCTVASTPLVGCYACLKGARTTFACVSKERGLATVKCGLDSFTIPCGPHGIQTERTLSFSYASVIEKCEVSCAEPIEIHGVLKYIGDITRWNTERTEAISWNDTAPTFVLPDFGHIVSVFAQHWYSSIVTVTIVIGCGIFTVIIIIPILIGLWQRNVMCKLFSRRRSLPKIPHKEL